MIIEICKGKSKMQDPCGLALTQNFLECLQFLLKWGQTASFGEGQQNTIGTNVDEHQRKERKATSTA